MSQYNNLTQELALDWLSFSFKYDDLNAFNKKHGVEYNQFDYLLNVAFPELSQVSYLYQAHFRSIYDKCIALSYDILVYYDTEDRQDKGCYVTVPSHALEYFCMLFNVTSLRSLFKVVIDRGGSFSRLDICYDDFTKRFNARDFMNWKINGQLNSRLRRYSYHSSGDGDTGTFYFGHRAGCRFLRIYDKLYESRKKVIQGKADDVIDSIRYEFELHSYAAQGFAEGFVKDGNIDFVAIIDSFFNVVDRVTNDISRCPTLPEWDEFKKSHVSRINTLMYPIKQRPKSYQSSRQYFITYQARLFNKLYAIEGLDFVRDVFERGSPEELINMDLNDFKIYNERILQSYEKV